MKPEYQTITQEQFNQIVSSHINRQPNEASGKSNEIIIPKVIFQNTEFDNVEINSNKPIKYAKFINCSFSKISSRSNIHIEQSEFEGCIFDNAIFGNFSFVGNKFDDACSFQGMQINSTAKVDYAGWKTALDKEIKVYHFVFSGENLRNADFSNFTKGLVKAVFNQGVDLTKVSFKNSDISETSFNDCRLYGTSFASAKCHHTKFEYKRESGSTCKGIEARAFRGADMLGAQLPEYLEEFKPLVEVVNDCIKNARNLFVVLMILCSAFLIQTFAGKKDETIRILGIAGPAVEPEKFYLPAALLVLGVFIYFQLYLQKMWRQMTYLPAIFPDGATMPDRVFPWLFTLFAWRHWPRLAEKAKQDKPEGLDLQLFIASLTGWGFPAITLSMLVYKLEETLPSFQFNGWSWFVILLIILVTGGLYRMKEKIFTS